MGCFNLTKDSLILHLKVKTNANTTEIKDYDDTSINISVKAVPEKGKANKEIIKFLSKLFKVDKNLIFIISGETCHNKVIEIKCSFTEEQIFEILDSNKC